MKYTYFTIKNFKGIENITVDFSSQPQSKVFTLVGLNESGKTTILEALNFFTYKTENLNPLNLPGYTIHDIHDLIPIGKRANFNDTISIETGIEMDEEEILKLKRYLQKEFNFVQTNTIRSFKVTQKYTFKDSKVESRKPNSTWYLISIGLYGRSKTSKKLKREHWLAMVKFVSEIMPNILFFPNFLFEFPDKIYLDEVTEESEKHKFYRTVIQDVLDALGKNLKLEKHLKERMVSNDRNDWRALDSVLLEVGAHITSTVFGSWNRIFKRRIGKKEIVVYYDSDENEKWYLELKLRDGNQLYSITERSLGFRWFFAFLLLTLYRGFRSDGTTNTLYLFDEPASNLHPSAQSQLLESFNNFPENSSIMYTTHSHHMINPEWLEGTYVVKNEGLDYEDEDNYNATNTNITLTKYRKFAVSHPDQTTYFQPILDVLDYSPGRLENVPNVVMVEGKNDFYTMKFFQDKVLKFTAINLMPGTGAGSLDSIIRLYIAWGRQFIILLDSDKEGIKQKKRYEELFGLLVSNRIFTLTDIDSSWGKEMESLIEKTDLMSIQSLVYPSSAKFNKTHFNRAIQELYLTEKTPSLSDITKERFKQLLEFCEERLKI